MNLKEFAKKINAIKSQGHDDLKVCYDCVDNITNVDAVIVTERDGEKVVLCI